MVATRTFSVALGLLGAAAVQATPIQYNPYTDVGDTVVMGKSHPAYGAPVAEDCVTVVVPENPDLPDLTTLTHVTVTNVTLLANSSGPSDKIMTTGTTYVKTTTTTTTSTSTSGSTTTTSTSTTTSTHTSTHTSTSTSGKTGVTASSTSGSSAVTVASSSGEDLVISNAIETTSGKTGVVTAAATTSASTSTSASDDNDEDDDACDPGFEPSSRKKKLRKLKAEAKAPPSPTRRNGRSLEASSTDVQKLETYFGESMVTVLGDLATSGEADTAPWPGPYWPMYQDGINVVWSSGEASAAEKYANAFSLDSTEFMNNISAASGIDAESSNTACTSDNDCSGESDSTSTCAIRSGKSSGYCIPSWYGICHAWTPAAILEDEPKCDVEYNGVTFHVMDLKALVTQIYDGADVTTVFTGVRYNGESDSTDEYGRHTNSAYRDLGPGFFHIAITNLLGRLGTSFIVDVEATSSVWNQPVRSYSVDQQQRYTTSEAGQTFYGVSEYPWNSAATSLVYVKTTLKWIYETYTDGALVSTGLVDQYTTSDSYTYLLELDDDDNIIGGEWVYDSDDDHPDFLWFPTGKPSDDTVTEVGLSYANVKTLLELAQSCSGSSTTTSGSTPSTNSQSSNMFGDSQSTPSSDTNTDSNADSNSWWSSPSTDSNTDSNSWWSPSTDSNNNGNSWGNWGWRK